MAGGRQNEKRLKILKEILKVQFDLLTNWQGQESKTAKSVLLKT